MKPLPSSVVRVRPFVQSLDAIRWTHHNSQEVHDFIRHHGWTTRYMSGAQGMAMYLHPRDSWVAARTGESTVRVGDWIVQGFGRQDGLVVVPAQDFSDQYGEAEAPESPFAMPALDPRPNA